MAVVVDVAIVNGYEWQSHRPESGVQDDFLQQGQRQGAVLGAGIDSPEKISKRISEPVSDSGLRISIGTNTSLTGPITVETPHGNITSVNSFSVQWPQLSAVNSEDGKLEVQWPSQSFIYVLEASETLRPDDWAVVLPVPILKNNVFKVILPAAVGHGFFRLRHP